MPVTLFCSFLAGLLSKRASDGFGRGCCGGKIVVFSASQGCCMCFQTVGPSYTLLQVTADLMKLAKPDCIFMNCASHRLFAQQNPIETASTAFQGLPAARGMEQTAEVIDGPQSGFQFQFDTLAGHVECATDLQSLLGYSAGKVGGLRPGGEPTSCNEGSAFFSQSFALPFLYSTPWHALRPWPSSSWRPSDFQKSWASAGLAKATALVFLLH